MWSAALWTATTAAGGCSSRRLAKFLTSTLKSQGSVTIWKGEGNDEDQMKVFHNLRSSARMCHRRSFTVTGKEG